VTLAAPPGSRAGDESDAAAERYGDAAAQSAFYRKGGYKHVGSARGDTQAAGASTEDAQEGGRRQPQLQQELHRIDLALGNSVASAAAGVNSEAQQRGAVRVKALSEEEDVGIRIRALSLPKNVQLESNREGRRGFVGHRNMYVSPQQSSFVRISLPYTEEMQACASSTVCAETRGSGSCGDQRGAA
jgi:hypothetical protein